MVSGWNEVAFVSKRNRNEEIYLLDVGGEDSPLRVTENAANDRDPCWLPDGAGLLFSSDRDGENALSVMDLDGANVTRLSDNEAMAENPAGPRMGERLPLPRIAMEIKRSTR